MANFKYVAVGPNGGKQTGMVKAPSLVSARYELVSRQLHVRSLKERKRFVEIEVTAEKIKLQEIANLSRQLSAFLRAGVSILEALEAASVEVSPKLRRMLLELAEQLRGGDSFADAVASHSQHFPSYYVAIVQSAELSGNLPIVLEQLAGYIDRDLSTRRKIKSALTYPAVVLCMTVVTVCVLVGFVLPKFADFFKSFEAKLPFTTRLMLSFGDFVTVWWWAMLGIAFASVIAMVMFLRSEAGRRARDRFMLRVPALREVVRASVVERFCRILSAMVRAGIPIANAMSAAIDSTDNRVFTGKLVPASQKMLRGEGLAQPLSETELFPPMVVQMMRVGEETGTLDQQLDVAADFYEAELQFKLDRFTALFEPAIIVVMAVIVGFVAVALVQAMYGIYSQSSVG